MEYSVFVILRHSWIKPASLFLPVRQLSALLQFILYCFISNYILTYLITSCKHLFCFYKKICVSNSSLKVTRMRHSVIQADFLPVFWILSHIHPAISEVFLDLSLYLLCFFHISSHKMAGKRVVSSERLHPVYIFLCK